MRSWGTWNVVDVDAVRRDLFYRECVEHLSVVCYVVVFKLEVSILGYKGHRRQN
jgi:hypothetical protein